MLALRWSDIDWDRPCIRVTRAYAYGKFGPPKSKASRKPVPMHPLLALLQQWRTETPYAGNEDFISPSIEVESPQPRNLHPLSDRACNGSQFLCGATFKSCIRVHSERQSAGERAPHLVLDSITM